jgi:hypothetical protein
MTTNKLRSLVAEAVSLDRQRAEIEARLGAIKNDLIAEARTREEEHTATDGGGWSWVAEGNDGCVARVTQEGPKLKATLTTDKDVAKAKELAGGVFPQLFEPKVGYKLAAGFRQAAENLLGPKVAAKLVRAFSGPGSVKVSYETKEAA